MIRKTLRRLTLGVVAGFVAGSAVRAQATTFSAEAVAAAAFAADGQKSSFSAVPTQAAASAGGGSLTFALAESRAGAGSTGAYSKVGSTVGESASTFSRPYPTPSDPSYRTSAGFDALVSLAAPATVSINLNLDGTVAWSNAGSGAVRLSVSVYSTTYSLLAAGDYEAYFLNGNHSAGGSYTYIPGMNASYQITGTEILSAYTGSTWTTPSSPNVAITTASFAVPANFRLLMSIEVAAQAAGGGSAEFNFLNSFSLAEDMPVFNFTGGANTANSPGLNLVNNMYVVPEPSTYAMALAGIACGGFSMWRRRKQA